MTASVQQIGKSCELVHVSDNPDVYTSDVSTSGAVYTNKSSTAVLWHQRLTHLNEDAVVTLAHSGTIGI